MKRQKDLSQSTKERLEVIAKLLFQWKQKNAHSMEVFNKPFKERIWSKVVDPELERLGMSPRAAKDWARPKSKAYIMNLLNNMDIFNPTKQSEPCEQSVSSEPTEPDNLDAKIDGRIEKKISQLFSASFLSDLPMPPPRTKEKVVITKGKRKGMSRMKELRDYERPSFSIDKRIYERFVQEASKRGMSLTMLLESILLKVFNIKLD